jgi:hypothetical protein
MCMQRYLDHQDFQALRRASPWHEAGHAVIARALGVPAGRASIAFDAALNVHGLAESGIPKRHNRRACRASAVVSMAGAEAERHFLGVSCDGDGSDRDHIAELLEAEDDPAGIEARCRATARKLVREHSGRIKLVARMLIACGELSGRELDRLYAMGRYQRGSRQSP